MARASRDADGQVLAALDADSAVSKQRYRVRLLSPSAVVAESEMTFADEGEALIQCHCMLGEYQTAEVWAGERLICRMARAWSG